MAKTASFHTTSYSSVTPMDMFVGYVYHILILKKVKVQLSRYRPGEAQSVPGS